KLADFGKGATKVESALNRMVDNFSGRKLIQEASLLTIALEKAGGVTTLTARELEQLGAKAAEAAEKMRKLGYEVPAGIQRLANEARAANAATESLSSSFLGLNRVLGGLGIGLSVSALAGFAKTLIQDADALQRMADQSGIGTEALQRLRL